MKPDRGTELLLAGRCFMGTFLAGFSNSSELLNAGFIYRVASYARSPSSRASRNKSWGFIGIQDLFTTDTREAQSYVSAKRTIYACHSEQSSRTCEGSHQTTGRGDQGFIFHSARGKLRT